MNYKYRINDIVKVYNRYTFGGDNLYRISNRMPPIKGAYNKAPRYCIKGINTEKIVTGMWWEDELDPASPLEVIKYRKK